MIDLSEIKQTMLQNLEQYEDQLKGLVFEKFEFYLNEIDLCVTNMRKRLSQHPKNILDFIQFSEFLAGDEIALVYDAIENNSIEVEKYIEILHSSLVEIGPVIRRRCYIPPPPLERITSLKCVSPRA